MFTCIIPYHSTAETIKVPRDGDAQTLRWRSVAQRIETMRAGGGTSFNHAFKQIENVLFGDTSGGKVRAKAYAKGTAEYEAQRRLGRQGLLVQGAPAFVKSVVICFMTDGQDNKLRRSRDEANTQKVREELVQSLRRILSKWEKKVVVHTVGFSRDHDFEFLDELRKVGTAEGSFRCVCEHLFFCRCWAKDQVPHKLEASVRQEYGHITLFAMHLQVCRSKRRL